MNAVASRVSADAPRAVRAVLNDTASSSEQPRNDAYDLPPRRSIEVRTLVFR